MGTVQGRHPMVFAELLVAGLVVGFLAGLLGIGGGFIVVPVLFILLPALGVGPEIVPKVAVATSLAAMVPTALSATFAQYRRGALEVKWLWRLVPGAALGAASGSQIAAMLTCRRVAVIFAVYSGYFALKMVRDWPSEKKPPGPHCARLRSCANSIGRIPNWSVFGNRWSGRRKPNGAFPAIPWGRDEAGSGSVERRWSFDRARRKHWICWYGNVRSSQRAAGARRTRVLAGGAALGCKRSGYGTKGRRCVTLTASPATQTGVCLCASCGLWRNPGKNCRVHGPDRLRKSGSSESRSGLVGTPQDGTERSEPVVPGSASIRAKADQANCDQLPRSGPSARIRNGPNRKRGRKPRKASSVALSAAPIG